MSTFRKASKTAPGVYWKTYPGKSKQKELWISFDAPKEWKDGKLARRQKWERVLGRKPTIKQARELRAQRLKEAKDGHHGEKADALFCDLEGAYREAVVATRANARTREAYVFQLKRLLKRFGPTRVTQIGAGDLEGFLAELGRAVFAGSGTEGLGPAQGCFQVGGRTGLCPPESVRQSASHRRRSAGLKRIQCRRRKWRSSSLTCGSTRPSCIPCTGSGSRPACDRASYSAVNGKT